MNVARPTVAELVEAVEEFLRDRLRPRLEGRDAFHCLVAANALAIVKRELAAGAAIDDLESRELEPFVGRRSASEGRLALVEAIRRHELDERTPGLLAALRRIAEERLAIDNPKYKPIE
jgi:Domain of unknown function (DUF6285)